MSLSGQLNDLSLGELIEFFCNQRKTGRLKVDYALAPGVFFIKEGHLVDAKVGALNGAEAVYFALTLPSASFDFSAGVLSSRSTIQESWARVVLEGLRRIDEGLPPAAADAFVGDDAPDEAALDYLNCVEEAKAGEPAAAEPPAAAAKAEAEPAALEVEPAALEAEPAALEVEPVELEAEPTVLEAEPAEVAGAELDEKIESDYAGVSPLSMTVESAGHAGRGKMLAAGAALVLVCAVVAVPVTRRLMRPKAETPAPVASAPQPEATPEGATGFATGETAAPEVSPTPDVAAAEDAARREQREREQRERARKQREEAARRAEEAGTENAAKPAPKPAGGAKTVRVQLSYDEAGRVTQASAVGSSPGAEAYASAAVRAARGRRFPAGKAGTTVVTIPVN